MIDEPGISDCFAKYKIKRAAKHTLFNDPKINECFHRILIFLMGQPLMDHLFFDHLRSIF